MNIPKVRDLKSKLASAKLLGMVVKNSLQFKLRRRTLKRFKSTMREKSRNMIPPL